MSRPLQTKSGKRGGLADLAAYQTPLISIFRISCCGESMKDIDFARTYDAGQDLNLISVTLCSVQHNKSKPRAKAAAVEGNLYHRHCRTPAGTGWPAAVAIQRLLGSYALSAYRNRLAQHSRHHLWHQWPPRPPAQVLLLSGAKSPLLGTNRFWMSWSSSVAGAWASDGWSWNTQTLRSVSNNPVIRPP